MANINLLPWRDALNARRRKRFMLGIIMFLLLGGMVAVGFGVVYQRQNAVELQKKHVLQRQHQQLSQQLARLEQDHHKAVQQYTVHRQAQELELQQAIVLRLFDEVSKITPQNFYLTELKRSGHQIELAGYAQRKSDVMRYVHQMNQSLWFDGAVLVAFDSPSDVPTWAAHALTNQYSTFKIHTYVAQIATVDAEVMG